MLEFASFCHCLWVKRRMWKKGNLLKSQDNELRIFVKNINKICLFFTVPDFDFWLFFLIWHGFPSFHWYTNTRLVQTQNKDNRKTRQNRYYTIRLDFTAKHGTWKHDRRQSSKKSTSINGFYLWFQLRDSKEYDARLNSSIHMDVYYRTTLGKQ